MRTTYRTTTGAFTRSITQVPQEEWPPDYERVMTSAPTEVWRSRDYLLMAYQDNGYTRLSVLRIALTTHATWADGIAWDELHRLKRECGRGDQWAVEVYPADAAVVNVANMRHLWVMDAPPAYGWHTAARDAGEPLPTVGRD
jgi:hypothetical protein